MKKRERGFTSMEEPSKRRREEEAGSSSDVDMEAPAEEEYVVMDEEEEEENVEDVKEKGMKLWQTVKDAVKDDRPLAINFLKRPNPRVWSDYYQIISSPIALEDIKRKIKAGEYANLESVRQDLELCFNNAKTYNQPESLIYSDAKDLLKLTNKTYRKLMPSEHGTGGKPPSMKRLLNSRVQKLIKKTDDYGRILSTEFMELPSKKLWPGYYQQIQQPRCIDAIQKQVKRKEYHSVSEFAADMELVFSNAMQFNVEHTQIWEDALALRDYFRQIMADLPPPHSLPQYAQPSINKIKIKVPAAHPAAPAPAPKTEEPATLPTLSLRVPIPAKSEPPEVKAPSPKPPAPAAPAPLPPAAASPAPVMPKSVAKQPSVAHAIPKPSVARPASKPPMAHPVPKPPAALKQSTSRTPQPSTPQPILQLHPTTAPSYSNTSVVKTVHTSYIQPTPPPMYPTAVPTPSYIAAPVPVPIPTPTPAPAAPPAPPRVIPPRHQLRYVTLTSEPRGRMLRLDHRDHVTSWAMRLERDEKSLLVGEVTFMAEQGDSSGEEDDGEDDEDMDVDAAPEPEPLKKRGRGRPPKAAKAAPLTPKTLAPKRKKTKKRGETQVKLNGTLVTEDEERNGNWTVQLSVGSNVVEVGEKGGLIWKVYAERVG